MNSANNENVTDPSDASNDDACEELNLDPSVQRTDVIISHYMPSMSCSLAKVVAQRKALTKVLSNNQVLSKGRPEVHRSGS